MIYVKTFNKVNLAVAKNKLRCHNRPAKEFNPFKRRAGWQKVSLTIHFKAIPESQCRRRVGRACGCPIQVKKTGVGRLTLLGGLRKIRGLRQAGLGSSLSFYLGH